MFRTKASDKRRDLGLVVLAQTMMKTLQKSKIRLPRPLQIDLMFFSIRKGNQELMSLLNMVGKDQRRHIQNTVTSKL